METGEEREIERILKTVTCGGVRWFLVKWLGFDESENEWVAEYGMGNAQEAVAEFRENECTRVKAKRNRGRSHVVQANVEMVMVGYEGVSEGVSKKRRERPRKEQG
ncbi:hypothetical protein D9619_012532 [Psilocybe cf. subviscida]|uniref:Chromo domain-containing protein n=1 Tax=Psilocybe cf. subviscida TaxID=2480587 RepID=A0A8H5B6H4_9AGAR|nr:hypothetical protein D9619_012532 [Psilocybe cf. subviscida]